MMDDKTRISSYRRVVPMIYAYQTPGYPKHEGWTKIGETKNGVDKRIHQQVHTAWIDYELQWQDNALFKDGSGEYFHDHDFHDFLERRKQVERNPGTEWFKIDGPQSYMMFNEFASRQYPRMSVGSTYVLREKQEEAVRVTLDYIGRSETMSADRRRFLWNAKPRFGKTLTTYELIRLMTAQSEKPLNVLIVTNRPSIANSWYDDFEQFIGWQTGFRFVSDNDALRDRRDVMTRGQFVRWINTPGAHDGFDGQICFESLQGLKGSVYFGGTYNKLEWMRQLKWDLLVIDEAHEGVDTHRTDRAFDNIQRRFTLHLSGTPFKAIAGGQFSKEQIFNWSYAEEQEAKEAWSSLDRNPYEDMPRLNLFTYRMSDIVRNEVRRGISLDDDEGTTEYAFDLNEFFKTDGGQFVYEQDVRKFLRALTTQTKFPFSTDELRTELAHTLWLLNRVESAKALARLLKEEGSGFEDYEVVLAAGDGRLSEDAETAKSYNKVKDAIAHHAKTITLSVGQLTTGVTIPEWSGVLMLSNMKSPSLYMQAAFRAQNPCDITREGVRYRKENAYVFDFDPARTLIIVDEFANNLRAETAADGGTPASREENIRRLLNFFPVIAEDENGRMMELDARQVLSIPRSIKSQEVVSRGFLCNFLFKNIANIFGAPGVVQDILGKLDKAHEDRGRSTGAALGDAAGVQIDDEGNAQVPEEIIIGQEQDVFGSKVYESFEPLKDECADIGSEEVMQHIDKIEADIAKSIEANIVKPAADSYGLTQKQAGRLAKDATKEVREKIDKIRGDYQQQTRIAEVKHEEAVRQAETEAAVKAADDSFRLDMEQAMHDLNNAIKQQIDEVVNEKPREVIERIETDRANRKKQDIEEEVRSHLRGFSRTIPSFIMAYDDGTLRLRNFDRVVTPAVFEEVTGITLEEFRFLRDGGDYEEDGVQKHFDGDLFDEVVFDDSIEVFRQKREALANYFDESLGEDIFDYIPPQKTNQIFTPKWVVRKMVDLLEQENPHIFEDLSKTFADLYMKSGLYITEIVRRLYNNEVMRQQIPDDRERILHILRHQVYGFAPTEIIYRIATRYILGFDSTLKPEHSNFRQVDTVPYAKEGRMEELIEKEFGV